MPVATRPWTRAELRLLEHLRDINMFVGAPDWRARRDLVLVLDEWRRRMRDEPGKHAQPTITMEQAQLLRRVAQRHLKALSPASQKTAQSPVGDFPYTKRERRMA